MRVMSTGGPLLTAIPLFRAGTLSDPVAPTVSAIVPLVISLDCGLELPLDTVLTEHGLEDELMGDVINDGLLGDTGDKGLVGLTGDVIKGGLVGDVIDEGLVGNVIKVGLNGLVGDVTGTVDDVIVDDE
uniref:Uncharacterized protein n=1 Tax=Cacopsylla melanoneura TaxID=428564 RepID=A0A8D8RRW5_9HEMI